MDIEAPQIDLSAILDPTHENKWVAVDPDYTKVIASAETLAELLRTVAGDAVFHRVLPKDVNFAPAA